ncbi:MAG: PDZ domain-containing protein [Coraliomargaritaceae bacterium]
MTRTCFAILIGAFTGLLQLLPAGPEQAVVKILNFSQQPDWKEPWRFSQVNQSSGSGFVIAGNRILTNAHVVSWSKHILVHRYQDPRPFQAEIEYIGHDCDLAVLRVADPAFFAGIEPLPIGELPEVRSSVTTYGYPAGGQQISYTRGVISRIEMQRYSHIYNRSLLAVQTDAAINPGNSGGPALQDERVVGVSFQGRPGLENAGFFIPPNIIRHFLKDIEDGEYHGFPDAGIGITKLQNPAFRRSLVLENDSVGARIDTLYQPFPETHKRLRPNDVLLAVSGQEVGSDALVQHRGNRIHCAFLFDEVQHGESIELLIRRDGKERTVDLPLYVNREDRISGLQYDQPPPYLIVGGLVFTELSVDYLNSLGNNWHQQVAAHTMYELLYRAQMDEDAARSKPILLSKVLKHPSNIDFGVRTRDILKTVNGRTIESMQDLYAALSENTGDFHLFTFLSGKEEALDRSDAEAADRELLQQYNIPASKQF